MDGSGPSKIVAIGIISQGSPEGRGLHRSGILSKSNGITHQQGFDIRDRTNGSEMSVHLRRDLSTICCKLLLHSVGASGAVADVLLFRRRLFALSVATSICSYAAHGLSFVSLPLLLRTVSGQPQVQRVFPPTPRPVVIAIVTS